MLNQALQDDPDLGKLKDVSRELSSEAKFVDYTQNLPLPSFPDEFDLESAIM